eukprot:7593733-Alexandrium_andersonii.AAC.1
MSGLCKANLLGEWPCASSLSRNTLFHTSRTRLRSALCIQVGGSEGQLGQPPCARQVHTQG